MSNLYNCSKNLYYVNSNKLVYKKNKKYINTSGSRVYYKFNTECNTIESVPNIWMAYFEHYDLIHILKKL